MAENAAISNLSEAKLFVVFEKVFDYISDVATLASLTLVSKSVRSTIFHSNGVRELLFEGEHFSSLKLNEVKIKGENREEKLKDGLRWLWTVGKRLKSVSFFPISAYWCSYCLVVPLVNILAATEQRRIETIEIRGKSCELALGLVKENSYTLRCLRVEVWDVDQESVTSLDDQESVTSLDDQESVTSLDDQESVSSLDGQESVSSLNPLLSELPESQSFWSVVRECKRLGSLDLCLRDLDSVPTHLLNVLLETPLKHLSLTTADGWLEDSEVYEKLIEVMSCNNLCNNLESLTLDYFIFDLIFNRLTDEMTDPRSSAGYTNLKKLTFEFVRFCCQLIPVNWSLFWAVFPALNEINDYPSSWAITTSDCANVCSFCKTYLEVAESRSLEIKFEQIPNNCLAAEELIAAVATDATLPNDKEWCDFHGVKIETEMSDQKIQRVILRKDTSTLGFDLKYTTE